MDHSLNLTRKAASIIDELMGSCMSPSVYYNGDGNTIIMEFHNYPIYGSGKEKTGNVYLKMPASTFGIRNGKVVFKRLAQADCRFYQNIIGKAFAHPHVFNDGHPCWNGGDRSRAVDFICNIVETFCLTNVTKDSIYIGHRASCVMGNDEAHPKDEKCLTGREKDENSLKNARRQEDRVRKKLHPKDFISDRRKLEAYASRRWVSAITSYMNHYKGGRVG